MENAVNVWVHTIGSVWIGQDSLTKTGYGFVKKAYTLSNMNAVLIPESPSKLADEQIVYSSQKHPGFC